VADRIREEILAGSFASGSLPEEKSLTARYGSSRNTVRDALRLLVAEGLLVRRPGLGTRVAAQKFAHSLDRLAGLAETLARQGTIANEVRVARWEAASPRVARCLEIEEGATVLYTWRGCDCSTGSPCRSTRPTSQRRSERICLMRTCARATCSR
jgi:GntR family transcriptional regulator